MAPTEKATEAELMPRACLELMTLVTLAAMVISRPSRTQATPRAMTMRVWNRDQPRRSMRAGMTLTTVSWSSPPAGGWPGASVKVELAIRGHLLPGPASGYTYLNL